MKLVRGVLLKPTLNLLGWILKRNGRASNSIIIGGPLGWSWQSTLDATHHGSLAGPANAHRHSDLANIGIDDHHARDHATRHAVGGGDQVSLDASQIGSGRFGMARMPDGTSGYFLKATGAGANPAYGAFAPDASSGDVCTNLAVDYEITHTNTTPTKVCEIVVLRGGTLRIKFDLYSGSAQIYRNGSAVGTLRTGNGSWVTYSEDISGWKAGDLCQLYTYASV